MEQKIARINELARKSRTPAGLTQEEKAEQQRLRQDYIEAVKRSLISQLENTYIVDEHGQKHRLKKRS